MCQVQSVCDEKFTEFVLCCADGQEKEEKEKEERQALVGNFVGKLVVSHMQRRRDTRNLCAVKRVSVLYCGLMNLFSSETCGASRAQQERRRFQERGEHPRISQKVKRKSLEAGLKEQRANID